MLLLLFFIVIVLLAVTFYYFKYTYFTLRGTLPGLPPQFLVGNLLQTHIIGRNEPFPTVFLKLKAKFGDAFQFWMGPMRVIVVGNLEDVQHIFANRHVYDQGSMFTNIFSLVYPNALICLRGAKYKRHSSAISFLFRRGKIVPHLDTIINCTDTLLNRWRTHYHDPTEIHSNINQQSQQLLLAIFGFIAFDYDLQTLDEENGSCKNELTQALHTFLEVFLTIIKLPEMMGRTYLLFNFKYQHARVVIKRYIYEMIEQELRETETSRAERKRNVLIASLITSLQQNEQFEFAKSEEENKNLSRAEVLDEMLFLLTAGYGTSATTLSWLIHLMSKHQRIQAKIKAELAEYNQQPLSIDQLDSLVYLDHVITELFRFVPPQPGTLRTLVMDDQLPASGVQLKSGEHVFIPSYNFGQDERYWKGSVGPEQFYPERFLVEDDNINMKAAILAFGGGHRQCVGQALARLELKAICARMMQFVTFGDGGPILNSGGYLQGDTISPKHVGVTISFD